MSYIDLFKHEYIGEISGLPLYRAQEDIDGDEFQCKEGQYIIGGGGGEHPAIIINEVYKAIFLNMHYENNDWGSIRDIDYINNLEFFGWMIHTYANFDKLARKNGYTDQTMDRNDDSGYPSIEFWLNIEFARLLIKLEKETK